MLITIQWYPHAYEVQNFSSCIQKLCLKKIFSIGNNLNRCQIPLFLNKFGCIYLKFHLLEILLLSEPRGSHSNPKHILSVSTSFSKSGIHYQEMTSTAGYYFPLYSCQSLVAQLVKNSAMQDTWVRYLGWKIPWRMERLPTPVYSPGELHRLAKSQTQLSNFHFSCQS